MEVEHSSRLCPTEPEGQILSPSRVGGNNRPAVWGNVACFTDLSVGVEASLGVCVDPVRNNVISSKPGGLRQITLACVHACKCLHTCEGVQAHAVHFPMLRHLMLVRGRDGKNGGRTESPESQPGKALPAAHGVSPASLRLSALFPRFIIPSSFLHCSYL